MQLTNKKSIRAALAAATCTVLSQPLQANQDNNDWDLKSGILYYSEADRVTVIAPTVSASKTLKSGDVLTLRAIYDSLTGASPNGATPTNAIQTFTSPSGESDYTTQAGDTPLRDLTDTRVVLGIDWETELSRLMNNTLTANISSERDYLSLGLSDTLKRDFHNRQTTVTAGLGLTLDTISPEGGTPVGLQLLNASGEAGGDEQKSSVDLLLGVTRILNRSTLTQLNLSHTHSTGYLTDPYKILSMIDPDTGETVRDTSNDFLYRYEKRPDTRTSDSLYWKLQHQLKEDVVYLSYRYFQDDWGIRSHTVDLKYRYELSGGNYLQPHYRHYQQTAADFYHHSLVDGIALPDYASADLRLGEMTGTTLGMKFGIPLSDGEFNIRFEKMVQTGESHPADAIGVQRNYDLYPTLDATIVQIGYSTVF